MEISRREILAMLTMTIPYLVLRKNLKRLWDSFSVEQPIKRYFLAKSTEVVPVVVVAERSPQKILFSQRDKPGAPGPGIYRITIPTGKMRRIDIGSILVQASPAVGTRTVTVTIETHQFKRSYSGGEDDLNYILSRIWVVSLTANQSRRLNMTSIPSVIPTNEEYWKPPDSFFLREGYRINITFTGTLADDNIEINIEFDELDYTGES